MSFVGTGQDRHWVLEPGDQISLKLDRLQAEGYLELLREQKHDGGFLEDADWLEGQMRKRGWLADGEEE